METISRRGKVKQMKEEKRKTAWSADRLARFRQKMKQRAEEGCFKTAKCLAARKRQGDQMRGKANEAVKKAHQLGKYASAHRTNTGKKHTAETVEKLRAAGKVRTQKRLEATQRMQAVSPEKRGLAKGMPNHLRAKKFVIRAPWGKIFSFSNLSEWARQHEHLFVDDATTGPNPQHPFATRIASGIRSLTHRSGRVCSYKGWVVVSKTELQHGTADSLEQPDL